MNSLVSIARAWDQDRRCDAEVSHDSWSWHQCSRVWKFEVDGFKLCGQHYRVVLSHRRIHPKAVPYFIKKRQRQRVQES